MEEEDGSQEEFGSAPGEEEAGWAKQNASPFCLSLLSFFPVCAVGGRRRKGEPPLGRRENLGCWVTVDGRGGGRKRIYLKTHHRCFDSGIVNTRSKKKKLHSTEYYCDKHAASI